MSLLEDLESLYKATQEHFHEYNMDVPENLEGAFIRLRDSLKEGLEERPLSLAELKAKIEKMKSGLRATEKEKREKPISEEEAINKIQYFIKATSLQAEFLKAVERSVPVESVEYHFGENIEKVVVVIDGEKREYDYRDIVKGMEDWAVKISSILEK